MNETGHHAKWRAIARGGIPSAIHQPTARGEFHLIIIIGLECGHGHTAFFHGLHVVIPLINAFVRGLPIGGPCEISGIDIGGDTVLKTMFLIRTNKVHFPR